MPTSRCERSRLSTSRKMAIAAMGGAAGGGGGWGAGGAGPGKRCMNESVLPSRSNQVLTVLIVRPRRNTRHIYTQPSLTVDLLRVLAPSLQPGELVAMCGRLAAGADPIAMSCICGPAVLDTPHPHPELAVAGAHRPPHTACRTIRSPTPSATSLDSEVCCACGDWNSRA